MVYGRAEERGEIRIYDIGLRRSAGGGSGCSRDRPDISYETSPKWHGFLMINLAAFEAGLNSEPQPATSSAESNIE